MSLDKANAEFEKHAKAALESLQRHLASVRTGRASTALLEGIKVSAYGQMSPLNQVATLTVPDPRTIAIQVWDKGVVAEVEKAIQQSNLGLNPQTAGNVVRVHLPDLTEERRKDLVKVVKKMDEECKVSIRHARQEANKILDKDKKDKAIGDDDHHKGTKHIQELTEKYTKKAEDIARAKEKEILEF